MMNTQTALSIMAIRNHPVEMVERKGIGHPDTICDALAEHLSIGLCKYYLEHFGSILHHNVDKALLSAGVSHARFGGGWIETPMHIYLAGRAVARVGDKHVPVHEIAIEGSRDWLRNHLHALDVNEHVKLHSLVHHGSSELIDLFKSGGAGAPVLANDTSFGVGYAPLSSLEQLVIALETERPPALAWGEDTKIMAVRRHDRVQVTVSCAMIDMHLMGLDEYLASVAALKNALAAIGAKHGYDALEIQINAADDPTRERVFLTVTGTSAESGDDGQVGRGNRVTGLITPYRPMSLEALAGKNPVSHVGKLYNLVASQIANTVVDEINVVTAANCALLSQIGKPVSEPMAIDIAVQVDDERQLNDIRGRVSEIANDRLLCIGNLTEQIIGGRLGLF